MPNVVGMIRHVSGSPSGVTVDAGLVADLVVEQLHAVDRRERRRVDPGQRAGVGDAVRGGDLGRMAPRPVLNSAVAARTRRSASARGRRCCSGPKNWSIIAWIAGSSDVVDDGAPRIGETRGS